VISFPPVIQKVPLKKLNAKINKDVVAEDILCPHITTPHVHSTPSTSQFPLAPGQGGLPYISYIVMCGGIGYGF